MSLESWCSKVLRVKPGIAIGIVELGTLHALGLNRRASQQPSVLRGLFQPSDVIMADFFNSRKLQVLHN